MTNGSNERFPGDEKPPEQPDSQDAREADGEPEETPTTGPTTPNAGEQPDGQAEPPPKVEPPQEPPLIEGIDLDSISLDDDYADGMEGDDGQVAAIPVRKPSRDWFIRTHPTAWKNVRLLELKEGADRGFYIIHRALWTLCQQADIPLRPVRLTLATSRESGAFLWPLKLQEKGFENRKDDWSASALRICKIAETVWVKVYTKEGGNCYSHKSAEGIDAQPVWPVQTFEQLLGLAFEGKVISDKDDPLLRRIMGKE